MKPPDPIPPLSPMAQLMIERANALIGLEAGKVRKEFPDWTEHEIQREAKRRHSAAMVHAADAIEAGRRKQLTDAAVNGGAQAAPPSMWRPCDMDRTLRRGNRGNPCYVMSSHGVTVGILKLSL